MFVKRDLSKHAVCKDLFNNLMGYHGSPVDYGQAYVTYYDAVVNGEKIEVALKTTKTRTANNAVYILSWSFQPDRVDIKLRGLDWFNFDITFRFENDTLDENFLQFQSETLPLTEDDALELFYTMILTLQRNNR